MFKKILSLILCLCMCLSVVLTATSCGDSSTTNSNTDDVPTTLTVLGITGETTTPENIELVEKELNNIFSARYKIKVDLQLVTADEYVDFVKEKIELAQYYETYDAAISKYNTYIEKQASSSYTTEKIFGNWIKPKVEVSLETLATRLLYVSEQTTVYEDGRVETVYPEARSPIDIVMIVDEDMYDEFDGMGLLKAIDPTYSSYQNLQKYIYPTYFSELKELKGEIKAIPNNNMLAEYTYLLVDKELADKYDFNINTFQSYSDLSSFLADVKENESVVPFAEEPEALGIFYTFSEDIAIGTYFDPINGFNADEENSGFEIENLFEIEEYVSHLELMEEYKTAGYFEGDAEKDGYAVKVVKGDASIAEIYAAEDSEYEVKVIQNPFVLREAVFDGMLAPTVYTSDRERAMEIIEAINTDSEVKNLLQYGIEGLNYEVNEDGTVTRLNKDYMMDNSLTGNVYMGYLEEGMGDTKWLYVQRTNLASALSPTLIYTVDDEYIESNLSDILKRAALSEALEPLGITYETYKSATGSMANTYGDTLKKQYKDFFMEKLVSEGQATEENAENVFSSGTPAYSWYEDQISQKIINEKYSTLKTSSELETLVETMMASPAAAYTLFLTHRSDAANYYSNIENMRIVARLTVFADLSDEEYEQRYGSLGAEAFELAVYNYLKSTYIEENNLSDEDYEELVKSFIASVLKYTDENNQQHTRTWEEFEQIKEDAQKFAEPIAKVRKEYNQMLLNNGFTQERIDDMDDIEFAEEVVAVIRAEFYREKNHTQKSYSEAVYNKILEPFGVDYTTFKSMQNKDNASYNDYLKKIKSYYKDQLLTTMTKDEYNNLTLPKVMDAVFAYFIENYTQAYAQMCEVAGLSYNEFIEYKEYMDLYISCTESMKTAFIYTLRTIYENSIINSWTPEEVEKYVYDVVYSSGYYMNEVAKTIGVTLSEYNYAKSSANNYKSDIETILKEYKGDLILAGYDVDVIKNYSPDEIEEILCEVIKEKYFSEYKSLEDMVSEYSEDYIKGLATADDVGKYCEESAKALSDNYLFKSLVSYLNENLQTELESLSSAS